MNPFDFFSLKTCLTLNSLEWEQGRAEIERVGIFDCIKFQALPDIGAHQSFNKSTRQILTDFNKSAYETLLFLEDDVQFRNLDHLEQALSELPSDWDIVYLGANLLKHEQCLRDPPKRYSGHLFRIFHAWTTHAIGYNKKVVPFLLENQPDFSGEMFDCWMGRQLKDLQVFIIAPMVAYQRPRYSEIWQRETDYEDVFRLSEERLR